jgi:hypothetical protein
VQSKPDHQVSKLWTMNVEAVVVGSAVQHGQKVREGGGRGAAIKSARPAPTRMCSFRTQLSDLSRRFVIGDPRRSIPGIDPEYAECCLHKQTKQEARKQSNPKVLSPTPNAVDFKLGWKVLGDDKKHKKAGE